MSYYYRKNLFGDIVEIYDDENQLAASYTYDAWGNCTIGTNVDNIANVNPFRYRGYYYDWETRYYYLQTRYYDAEVGRFLNADSIEYLDLETINGCNLYAYGLNNPIEFCDPSGCGIITTLLIGFAVGFIVSGVSELVNQLIENEGELTEDSWREIGIRAVLGGLAGSVSVIPGVKTGVSVVVGLAESLIGDYATGNLNSWGDVFTSVAGSLLSFGVGEAIESVARAIDVQKLMRKTADGIASMSRKKKSLKIMKLLGDTDNYNRNAYKDWSAEHLLEELWNIDYNKSIEVDIEYNINYKCKHACMSLVGVGLSGVGLLF